MQAEKTSSSKFEQKFFLPAFLYRLIGIHVHYCVKQVLRGSFSVCIFSYSTSLLRFTGNIQSVFAYSKSAMETAKICLKLTGETPEPGQKHHSGVFIDNFEQISYIVLLFRL